MRITILGAGSWGSALSVLVSGIADVLLWSRNKAQIDSINNQHSNLNYLPEDVRFRSNVRATDNLLASLDCDLLIIATPVNALRSILQSIRASIKYKLCIPDIIWVCKGFEDFSGLLPHNIIEEVLKGLKVRYGALLGPSFALDVIYGRLTAISLVSSSEEFAIKWSRVFNTIPNFRVYLGSDIVGAEVCGAIKNVVAIAAGIVDGLGLGLNARSALIARSLNEIVRLIIALGGSEKTAYGLVGVGDLILTCTGDLSRNRMVGLKLSQGMSLEEILNELGHVAEGVKTSKAAYELSNRLGVDMPIVCAIHNILYQGIDLTTAIESLLSRKPGIEFV